MVEYIGLCFLCCKNKDIFIYKNDDFPFYWKIQ